VPVETPHNYLSAFATLSRPLASDLCNLWFISRPHLTRGGREVCLPARDSDVVFDFSAVYGRRFHRGAGAPEGLAGAFQQVVHRRLEVHG
jgi:hypothetical protein